MLAQIAPQVVASGQQQVLLSIAVLIFGLLIAGGSMVVMLKRERGWGPQSTQLVGITLVVTAGLFLVTAGYSQDQIAPMIGLLGTIAGYLLGRGSNKAGAA